MTTLDRAEVSRRRARAGRIRMGMTSYIRTLGEIAAAHAERDWEVLGYPSWDEYVKTEFDADRLGLPAEQRQKAVVELRLAGLSQREIGSALNVDAATVNRDLRSVANATRELQSPQVTDSGPTGVANGTPPADPDETPARRDPDPSFLPGPAIATPDEPVKPEEVAPAAGGREDGAASSTEPPAGPAPRFAQTGDGIPDKHPDRPGLDDPYSIEARRESERRAAVANLRSVLTYLVSASVSPTDLAERDYGVALDEFKQDDLDFAASTMRAIAELKGK